MKPTRLTRYAVTRHYSSGSSAPKCSPRIGRAVLSTGMSRISRNRPLTKGRHAEHEQPDTDDEARSAEHLQGADGALEGRAHPESHESVGDAWVLADLREAGLPPAL